MAWTTPKTDWETGELVAASDMNAIGENLAARRNLAIAAYTTTASTRMDARNFSDVDSDNLSLTITTTGGDVLVHFHGMVYVGSRNAVSFDLDVDGTRQGGNDGIGRMYATNSNVQTLLSFTRLIQGLSAGSHTFNLKCKSNGAINLAAGAQFWVREI